MSIDQVRPPREQPLRRARPGPATEVIRYSASSSRTLASDQSTSRFDFFSASRCSVRLPHQPGVEVGHQLDDGDVAVVRRDQPLEVVGLARPRPSPITKVKTRSVPDAAASSITRRRTSAVERPERRRAVVEDVEQHLDAVVVVEQPEVGPVRHRPADRHLADGGRSEDQQQAHPGMVPHRDRWAHPSSGAQASDLDPVAVGVEGVEADVAGERVPLALVDLEAEPAQPVGHLVQVGRRRRPGAPCGPARTGPRRRRAARQRPRPRRRTPGTSSRRAPPGQPACRPRSCRGRRRRTAAPRPRRRAGRRPGRGGASSGGLAARARRRPCGRRRRSGGTASRPGPTGRRGRPRAAARGTRPRTAAAGRPAAPGSWAGHRCRTPSRRPGRRR